MITSILIERSNHMENSHGEQVDALKFITQLQWVKIPAIDTIHLFCVTI